MGHSTIFLLFISYNAIPSYLHFFNIQKNDVKGTRRTRSTQYAVGLVVIYNGLDTAETIVGVISSRMNSMFQYVLLEGGDSDYVSERTYSSFFLNEINSQIG